ncbi:aspartyl-phosphate phosphatase Spo0E family protein (plasmid) [Metabacillus halosaccharovorans]|uniref:aspartyl-phosphate phosphatase Spo0E family protein n=1 Tax=Metabacillus halosaccharovorans TaxID=930124 RepID=UPI001C200976|nr:aspartyl-phosphate phosphatase Spo0E family protein [Metabacillus halosaccharovorans]MBU7595845.1 aspartyl-phosphate phosphatase Spo0E family protein [Metabacillus halosaccharovorans]MCM3441430.1 aspartyl-phosphate phosphatase Spo0E family protein [Metabacillus halosaccharovorans]
MLEKAQSNGLLSNIELIRDEMIKLSETYGFSHHKTVEISQRLDVLLNMYQKISKGTNIS